VSDDVPNLRPHGMLSWLPIVIAVMSPVVSVTVVVSQLPTRAENNDVVLRLTRVEIEQARQSTASAASQAAAERTEAEVRRQLERLSEQLSQQPRRPR
jgi:hypothetical protein